jgi:hypothetical protein
MSIQTSGSAFPLQVARTSDGDGVATGVGCGVGEVDVEVVVDGLVEVVVEVEVLEDMVLVVLVVVIVDVLVLVLVLDVVELELDVELDAIGESAGDGGSVSYVVGIETLHVLQSTGHVVATKGNTMQYDPNEAHCAPSGCPLHTVGAGVGA